MRRVTHTARVSLLFAGDRERQGGRLNPPACGASTQIKKGESVGCVKTCSPRSPSKKTKTRTHTRIVSSLSLLFTVTENTMTSLVNAPPAPNLEDADPGRRECRALRGEGRGGDGWWSGARRPSPLSSLSLSSLSLFHSFPPSLSRQLWRYVPPVPVLPVPDRLVLRAGVPEGACVWSGQEREGEREREAVTQAGQGTPSLNLHSLHRSPFLSPPGPSTPHTAGRTSLRTLWRKRNPGLRPGCGGTGAR